MAEALHRSVTVSRQVGSGGSYIAYLLAKELGFKYVDREILRRAAEHLGTEPGLLDHYEERASGFVETVLTSFTLGVAEMAYVPPLQPPIYNRDLFKLESRIMNDVADRYNAVIVGRGGYYALRGRSDVTHVFIHAPEEFRIKRFMQVQRITDVQQARKKLRDLDRRRTNFAKVILGINWTDARNYHLSIDAGEVGFSESVALIKDVVAASAK